MRLEELIIRIKEKPENVLNVYLYGSRVYGNIRKDSDYDFIVVLKKKRINNQEQFSDNLINVQFYTVDDFQRRLDNHEISALECYFLPEQYILKRNVCFSFKLVIEKLRESLSTKANNSFVKAYKKLTIEKDYNLLTAQKSLWHSFRIIYFGIQIAKYGKITDYSECNAIFWDILRLKEWDDMVDQYKKSHNNIMSQFRILAPKKLM